MKKAIFRKPVIILGIVAILGTAGVAAANPMYGSSGYPNQEQATKARELFSEHQAAISPLRQQLNAKQAELNTLLYSDTPDTAKIEAVSRDIGSIQGQIYASQASLTAQLAKDGLPADGWQTGRCAMRGYGHGGGDYGHRDGGYGRHGGGHW